jgi:NADPH:quinone reductase-like Zn-dependent oxidoreductase
LPLPRTRSSEENEEEEEHADKVILITNGASEIGSLAIQLATASGVRVITTASQSNIKFVQSLGASLVIDESDPSATRAQFAAALGTGSVQLSGIFDTRSTEQSFAQIDTLLQDIAQNPRVCAVKPPGCAPRSFVPTVGELDYTPFV